MELVCEKNAVEQKRDLGSRQCFTGCSGGGVKDKNAERNRDSQKQDSTGHRTEAHNYNILAINNLADFCLSGAELKIME